MMRIFLLSFLLLASTFIHAQGTEDETRWYKIEIIVLAATDPAAGESEVWPDDPGMPAIDDAIELVPPSEAAVPESDEQLSIDLPADVSLPETMAGNDLTAEPLPQTVAPEIPAAIPYQLLEEQDLTLTTAEDKLVSSGSYKPLLHVAWRQPVTDRENTRAVHIFSALDNSLATQSPVSETALPPPPIEFSVEPSVSVEGEEKNVAGNALDGTIAVILGRYLHIDVDLLYQAERTLKAKPVLFNFGPPEKVMQSYRLTQSRRMRSSELHYFDHPVFGVLAQITPYELPAQPEEDLNVIPLDSTGNPDILPPDEEIDSAQGNEMLQ